MATAVELLRKINLNTLGGLAVTSGQADGYSVVDKFGENPVITAASDPEDIWEFGGLYNYDTVGTAPIAYVSSSSAADTGQTIVIQGLDITGALVDQEITTTGQSNVTLTTPLWRVFRMENNSSNDIAGVLYCHIDPAPTNGVPADIAVRAIISGSNNQTLMALYTIPLGKVGFLFKGELGMDFTGSIGTGTNFAKCRYYSRRVGKVFKVKKSLSLITAASSNYSDDRPFPDVIPALTDIRITAQEVSEDMGIWATFAIMLVDEELLDSEYLTAIGQPSVMPS